MKSRHLSDEQALDLVMGESGAEEIHAHLVECGACSERVRQANEGRRLAATAKLPEPSPLYWEASKRRIGRALNAGESPRRQWRWLGLAAIVTAILATVAILAPVFVGLSRDQRTETFIEAWSALPSSEEDTSLPALERMLDDDTASSNGCHLGSCVLVLSDEEIQDVSELLRVEMGRSL